MNDQFSNEFDSEMEAFEIEIEMNEQAMLDAIEDMKDEIAEFESAGLTAWEDGVVVELRGDMDEFIFGGMDEDDMIDEIERRRLDELEGE